MAWSTCIMARWWMVTGTTAGRSDLAKSEHLQICRRHWRHQRHYRRHIVMIGHLHLCRCIHRTPHRRSTWWNSAVIIRPQTAICLITISSAWTLTQWLEHMGAPLTQSTLCTSTIGRAWWPMERTSVLISERWLLLIQFRHRRGETALTITNLSCHWQRRSPVYLKLCTKLPAPILLPPQLSPQQQVRHRQCHRLKPHHMRVHKMVRYRDSNIQIPLMQTAMWTATWTIMGEKWKDINPLVDLMEMRHATCRSTLHTTRRFQTHMPIRPWWLWMISPRLPRKAATEWQAVRTRRVTSPQYHTWRDTFQLHHQNRQDSGQAPLHSLLIIGRDQKESRVPRSSYHRTITISHRGRAYIFKLV